MATTLTVPRRSRLFYGWYIVAVAIVAQFVAVGTQMFAAGVFLKPMTTDFGWSRESFAAVQTLSLAVSGVVGIFIGGILDRRGPRLLMLAGGVISGATLAATALVDTYWQFVLLRGIAQTIGIALCGNLVVNVTVSRWFVRRRGTAVALASVGISLAGVLMVPLLSRWVNSYGWQSGWVMLGVLVTILILPSALIMRRSPEDLGLLPDGALASAAPGSRHAPKLEEQWTRPEALRTAALWFVIVGYGFATLGLGAFILQTIPFLTDDGFSPGTAAVLLSSFSWASLASKAFWGPAMDRVHARHLSVGGFAVAGFAMAALPAVSGTGSTGAVLAVLALYGFAMGGTAPLQETVWADYFGRLHLGSIRAVAMPFSILFSAGGPLLGGRLFTVTGSYGASFIVFAATLWLGALLILAARPPIRAAPP
ncbi:MAG: MFS transporter [Dehalococcoidia bacterium]